MSKPPPRRIPSDDYKVTQDGIEYHAHEGEWVEFSGRPGLVSLERIWAFESVLADEHEPEKPDAKASNKTKLAYVAALNKYREERNAQIDSIFRDICVVLARHIVAWSWTDDRGEQMSQPDGNPDTIRDLRADEILFLRDLLARNETKAERKNESSASEAGL